MIKLKFYIPLFFLIVSCSKKQNETFNEESTPTSITGQGDVNLGSFSKRYKEDMVEKLYTEALDNDSDLKKLENEIEELEDQQENELRDYNKYQNLNQEYYQTVNRYLDRIEDSTLRKTFDDIFTEHEKRNESSTIEHEKLISSTKDKTIILSDQRTLLKLLTSMNMMDIYQKNELPKLKPLQHTNASYKATIKKTQTHINKIK